MASPPKPSAGKGKNPFAGKILGLPAPVVIGGGAVMLYLLYRWWQAKNAAAAAGAAGLTGASQVPVDTGGGGGGGAGGLPTGTGGTCPPGYNLDASGSCVPAAGVGGTNTPGLGDLGTSAAPILLPGTNPSDATIPLYTTSDVTTTTSPAAYATPEQLNQAMGLLWTNQSPLVAAAPVGPRPPDAVTGQ